MCEDAGTLVCAVFDLSMGAASGGGGDEEKFSAAAALHRRLAVAFEQFEMYPWYAPGMALEPVIVGSHRGSVLRVYCGQSQEDVDVVKALVRGAMDHNSFATLRFEGHDLILPDYSELEGPSEEAYEISHRNRVWWSVDYGYRIPQTDGHQITLCGALDYLQQRSSLRLGRFRLRGFVLPLSETLGAFRPVRVHVTRKLARLLHLNPWLARRALQDDYAQCRDLGLTVLYPGVRLTSFQNLGKEYRLRSAKADEPEESGGAKDHNSDSVTVVLLLNTLAASILENCPFQGAPRGVLLTNAVELFLQQNNMAPIEERATVVFTQGAANAAPAIPSADNALDVGNTVHNFETLLSTFSLSPTVHPTVQLWLDENGPVKYSAEEANLELFLRPSGEDPLPAAVSRRAAAERTGPPSSDEFFEFFLANALKMSAEDIAAMRSAS